MCIVYVVCTVCACEIVFGELYVGLRQIRIELKIHTTGYYSLCVMPGPNNITRYRNFAAPFKKKKNDKQ